MATSTTTTRVGNLTGASPDGTYLGQSAADLVGYWGIAPVNQPAATAQSAWASTVITTVSSTSLTTLDLTKINALISRVAEIDAWARQTRTDLVEIGIQKGSI